MKKWEFILEITTEVEAETYEEAKKKINDMVSDFKDSCDVVLMSEKE